MRALEIRSRDGTILAGCLFECDVDGLISRIDCDGMLPLGSYQSRERSLGLLNLGEAKFNFGIPTFVLRLEDLDACDRDWYRGCCGPNGDRPNIRDPSRSFICWEYSDCRASHSATIAAHRVAATEFEAVSDGWFISMVDFMGRPRVVERAIARTRAESELRLRKATALRISQSFVKDPGAEARLLASMKILRYEDAREIITDNYQSFFQTKRGDEDEGGDAQLEGSVQPVVRPCFAGEIADVDEEVQATDRQVDGPREAGLRSDRDDGHEARDRHQEADLAREDPVDEHERQRAK
jgi:hypothetical protein